VERFLSEALNDALAQLPDKQRRTVELTAAGHMSRDEIADEVGVRTGTLSSHRARSLRKLADVLGPIITMISSIVNAIVHAGVRLQMAAFALIAALLAML
jgi:DNA-directed RNA polymerase specialized sigma24 family protein